MIAAWFAGAWAWAGKWLAGIGAVILAALAIAGIAWRKGDKAGAAKGESEAADAKAHEAQSLAEAAQSAVEAANQSAQVVRDTHETITKMPDDGTQRIGDATAGTAAGWLRAEADRDHQAGA